MHDLICMPPHPQLPPPRQPFAVSIPQGVDAAAIAEAANSGAGLSALAEKLAGSRLLIDGFSCAAPTVLCDLVDEGTPARQLLPSAAYRR
jgi:hypothetical protein